MDLDRLKTAWQADDADGRAPDLQSLMGRLAQLDRQVHRRDLREYIAAGLVMAIFGWRAAVTDEPLVRIGCLVVVLGSMFVIVWSRRATAPRQPFTGDLPMALYCARELEKVDGQVRLLRSVWWWYVTPTVVGILMTLVPGPVAPGVKLLTAAFVVGVGAVIVWLNVEAARREVEPLRDALRQHLTELRAGQ
jgi:hypothetical protein